MNDKHDSRRVLTDTGERRALANEAARSAVDMERAQTPRPSDSAVMFDIAERVVERSRPGEWVQCETTGPAAKLRNELVIERGRINVMHEEQIKLIAVLGFWKWALPVAVAMSGVIAGLAVAILKAWH
jgi:hypothetical protein